MFVMRFVNGNQKDCLFHHTASSFAPSGNETSQRELLV